MKVFATVLLTLTLLMVYASNDNNQPMDEEEGWFVPDFDYNITWIPKALVLEELKTIPEGLSLVQHSLLYTPLNPKNGQRLIRGSNDLLDKSNFNISNPTSIIIHGWRSSPNSAICTLVRDALLKREPCNVICVNWSDLADRLYAVAVYKLKSVAKEVSDFVYFLSSQAGLPIENLTLIGHSLGAHIAGFAGKNLRPKVYHIIGCDPAGPMFFFRGCDGRLCNTDAKFVESIHTAAKTLGLWKPIGGADYYPAGGRTQPGCDSKACDHSRSYIYLAEALLLDNFIAKRCKSVAVLYLKGCGSVDKNLRMASPSNYAVNGIFDVPIHAKPNYGTN